MDFNNISYTFIEVRVEFDIYDTDFYCKQLISVFNKIEGKVEKLGGLEKMTGLKRIVCGGET